MMLDEDRHEALAQSLAMLLIRIDSIRRQREDAANRIDYYCTMPIDQKGIEWDYRLRSTQNDYARADENMRLVSREFTGWYAGVSEAVGDDEYERINTRARAIVAEQHKAEVPV